VFGVTAVRRLLFPLGLARARLGRRLGRVALVGLGLAAAAATLAAVLAGGLVAQDRSVSRAIERIPEPERAIRVAAFGVPGERDPAREELDRAARGGLTSVAEGDPVATLLFRTGSIGGVLVDLGAVEGLAPWVRLESGRLPEPCRPERCEVVRIRGEGPAPAPADVRIVEVGEASLVSETLFGRFVEPGAYHQPATPPLLLAEGVETLASAPSLSTRYRTSSWVLPLRDGSVRAWETRSLENRVVQARVALGETGGDFEIEAPAGDIAAAGETARAAGTRLLVIGGQAAALLVAFALLAAAALRRDVEASRRRLTWFGARRAQLEVGTAAEVGVVALVGTALGWAIGAGIAVAIARETGTPAGDVFSQSVLSGAGLAAGAGLAVGSALVLFLAVRARPVRLAGLAITPLDVAALGALGIVAVTLLRGSADADALAREGGTGALLLLLPGLVAFVAAVAFARVLGPGLRALELLARRGSVPVRLAALSLARRPGPAAIAIGFLVVSLGLALFAETYRSTLARGQTDQAAFAVPADAVVREDLRQLVAPLEAAALRDYEHATGGGTATPVLRVQGSVPRLGVEGGVTLLGLPAEHVAGVGGWRDDFAGESREELAQSIRPERPAELAGIELPPDARELRLDASVTGAPVLLTASLQTPEGRFVSAELGRLVEGRPAVLGAPVPLEARGGRLVALTFSPPIRIEEPGASAGRAVRGVLTTRGVEIADGDGSVVLRPFDEWVPTNTTVSAVVSGGPTEFHYALTNQVVSRFRPRQASDEGPVPALATPRLAAAAGPGGTLSLDAGRVPIRARVVGTVERFPGIEGEGLVADRDLLATAMNSQTPGSAEPNEVWLVAPDPVALGAALGAPPFDVLAVTERAELERSLRADPLARAALLTLGAAALVALALALVGLLLGVVADLRDERGELFDLEAQGAAPADLRRQVRLRAGIVAAVGVAGGALTGAFLSLLVVDLVRLTANAARPEPPLLVAVDLPVVVAAVAVYVLAAALVVGLATARAFRSPAPSRVSEAAT
jgi:hypothetical protein